MHSHSKAMNGASKWNQSFFYPNEQHGNCYKALIICHVKIAQNLSKVIILFPNDIRGLDSTLPATTTFHTFSSNPHATHCAD